MKAYLAQTKIITFENKRPNVLAKCAVACTQVSTLRSMHTGLQIVAVYRSMRLGRYTFRSTVASFIFLPPSSILIPASSKVTPTSSIITVARNTFTPPTSKVAPTSSEVAHNSSKKIGTVFILTPTIFKNRETCFVFRLCNYGIIQLTM